MKTLWYLPIGLALVTIPLFTFLKPETEKTSRAYKDVPPIQNLDPMVQEDEDSTFLPSRLKKDLPHRDALKYAKSTAKSNNQFAEDFTKLYIKSKSQKHQNIFFSPFSISSALSMTGEGAKGETQKQILNVFHLSDVDSVRKYGVLGLYELLNTKSSYKLNTSNSLWIRQGQKLNAGFLESARDFYRANVEFVDFSNASSSSKTINQFVEKKTENRIKDLISPGMINADTRLILTNTIYFKADWLKMFDADDTREEYFTTSDGQSAIVDMMQQKSNFNYFENESFQALEMEYNDNEMSMVVILPKSEDESSIAAIDLNKAINIPSSQFKSQEIRVSFPKFKFETSYSLKEDLSKMGMPLAFDGADFSGISSESKLKISEVVHKAFVEVGEKGTEAAAATAVIMAIESAKPPMENPVKVFRADHPFIFMIRHNATGTILFMGVVNNPKSK